MYTISDAPASVPIKAPDVVTFTREQLAAHDAEVLEEACRRVCNMCIRLFCGGGYDDCPEDERAVCGTMIAIRGKEGTP